MGRKRSIEDKLDHMDGCPEERLETYITQKPHPYQTAGGEEKIAYEDWSVFRCLDCEAHTAEVGRDLHEEATEYIRNRQEADSGENEGEGGPPQGGAAKGRNRTPERVGSVSG